MDLGSNNGTFVNGQQIAAAPLAEGDIVGIGAATFRLAGHELQEFAGAALTAGRGSLAVGLADRTAPARTAEATARSRSRTRSAGWCRGASGSRTSTS